MVKIPDIKVSVGPLGTAEIIRSKNLDFDEKAGVLASHLIKLPSMNPGRIVLSLGFETALANEPFAWAVPMNDAMSPISVAKLGTDEIKFTFTNLRPIPRDIMIEVFILAY